MPDHSIEITDEERAKIFSEIFGTTTVKVTSPTPQEITLPEGKTVKAFYLDLSQITPEQRKKLVSYLANTFNFSEKDVDEKLEEIGVPILDENCVLKE